MKQFDEYNEDELRQIEEQLRSFPEPFSSDAPDDRYFANFRVRLMERIEAEQPAAKPSVFAALLGWFTPMRTLATGLAVVIVALGSAWLFSPSPAPQMASQVAPTTPATQSVEATATKPTQPVSTPTVTPVPQAPKQVAEVSSPKEHGRLAKVITPKTVSAKDVADAIFAEVGLGDVSNDIAADDSPMDYASLSSDELQAVLDGISR
ncbi:MAG: hypothetical protein JSS75_13660 [Bacteroidetes bacterium]|nr:hypothetical protein [Bacteroidota bacterium]